MYTLHNVGDQALLVEFENEISMEVNRKVMALKGALEAHRLPGIGELVPTYRSLAIHYDPLTADLEQLKEAIDQSVKPLGSCCAPQGHCDGDPCPVRGGICTGSGGDRPH